MATVDEVGEVGVRPEYDAKCRELSAAQRKALRVQFGLTLAAALLFVVAYLVFGLGLVVFEGVKAVYVIAAVGVVLLAVCLHGWWLVLEALSNAWPV